ncbi:MAG: Co/Zn/Cd efflux system component [Marinobacter maritimus]|jgi:Co/Zn/Cd efflux system component
MACSCSGPELKSPAPGFRRALWIALWVNLAMFFVEGVASLQSGSVSLMADAIDFFGDSANYILSLSVLSMGMLWRGRAALVKGITMALFGTVVWARALWVMQQGTTPEPFTMGSIGLLALIANLCVAFLLFRFRDGDSDMRSVWLCSRNDAISNLAVMAAALGVFGTGSAWPDLIVAAIMGTLAITAGVSVVRHARQDIGNAKQTSAAGASLEVR